MSLQIETIEILRAITHRLYMFKPTASTDPGDRNRRQCVTRLYTCLRLPVFTDRGQ